MNQDPGPSNEFASSQEESEPLRAVSPESPCPYLPGLQSRSEAYLADGLTGEIYEAMMAHGFRRSGRVVYRPVCRGCRACQQIRVLVDRFHPTRSMRRVRRANRDVEVVVGVPRLDAVRVRLFRRYLDYQHDGAMARTTEALREFLYDSPMETLEFAYYASGTLIAVSIADVCPNGLSSVYVFFEPDESRRSLGTYSALWEIDYSRRNRLAYYYLGFYVANCATMSYKARFRPNQVLVEPDRWAIFRDECCVNDSRHA